MARRRAAHYDGLVDDHELRYDDQYVDEDEGPDALSAAAGRVASIVGAA